MLNTTRPISLRRLRQTWAVTVLCVGAGILAVNHVATAQMIANNCFVDSVSFFACNNVNPGSMSCVNSSSTWTCSNRFILNQQCKNVLQTTNGRESADNFTAACVIQFVNCGTITGECVFPRLEDSTLGTFEHECVRAAGGACTSGPKSGGGGPGTETPPIDP